METPPEPIEIPENEGMNAFGLDDEADTNSTVSTSGASSIGMPKKTWSDSEILSKLKSGDLKATFSR